MKIIWSYDIWFLIYKVRQTDIFVILGHFCPFSPRTIWKIIILKLKKNPWRYYHFTHLHRKSQSYDVWFLGYGVQQTVVCPFTSLTAWKIKILKKWKKRLEISLLYNSVPKIMITCYTIPEIWRMTDVIIFHFVPFFALLPSL